jgi:hypothetical protein
MTRILGVVRENLLREIRSNRRSWSEDSPGVRKMLMLVYPVGGTLQNTPSSIFTFFCLQVSNLIAHG